MADEEVLEESKEKEDMDEMKEVEVVSIEPEKKEIKQKPRKIKRPKSESTSKEKTEVEAKTTVRKAPVMGDVVNRTQYPRQLIINGRWEVIPGRGKYKNIDKSLVGRLPKGVVFIKK